MNYMERATFQKLICNLDIIKKMRKDDIHKTTFRYHNGHFKYLVLSLGLTNAPTTFQSCMNQIFQQQLRKFLIIFFDDIIIHSKTWKERLRYTEEVLRILGTEPLFAKISKCEFGLEDIIFLGHKINAKGVSVDKKKFKAIKGWPRPKTLIQVRGFVDLCSYYPHFVKGFSKKATPLTDLTKKGAFSWNDICQ